MKRRAPRILMVLGACLLMVMSVGGTAFAAGGPGTHPVIDTVSRATLAPLTDDPGTGCADIIVHGHGFTPSTSTYSSFADVFVIASTDGLANFQFGNIILVDTKGRIASAVRVCDASVSPDLIEWAAQDGTTYYFSNRDYTILKGTLSAGTEEPGS